MRYLIFLIFILFSHYSFSHGQSIPTTYDGFHAAGSQRHGWQVSICQNLGWSDCHDHVEASTGAVQHRGFLEACPEGQTHSEPDGICVEFCSTISGEVASLGSGASFPPETSSCNNSCETTITSLTPLGDTAFAWQETYTGNSCPDTDPPPDPDGGDGSGDGTGGDGTGGDGTGGDGTGGDGTGGDGTGGDGTGGDGTGGDGTGGDGTGGDGTGGDGTGDGSSGGDGTGDGSSGGDCDPALETCTNSASVGEGCEPTDRPVCDGDAIQCAQLDQIWLDRCDGNGLGSLTDCDLAFDCDGDPINCERARLEKENYCAIAQYSDLTAQSVFAEEGLTSIDDYNRGDAFSEDEGSLLNIDDQVTGLISSISEAGGGQTGSCPSDMSASLGFADAIIPYQPICDMAAFIRPLIIAIASFIAIAGLVSVMRGTS